jgi:hypothetical protein
MRRGYGAPDERRSGNDASASDGGVGASRLRGGSRTGRAAETNPQRRSAPPLEGTGRAIRLIVELTCFEILAELFAQDVDRDLLKRSLGMTPTERIIWLEEMQGFAEAAEKGRRDEAESAALETR